MDSPFNCPRCGKPHLDVCDDGKVYNGDPVSKAELIAWLREMLQKGGKNRWPGKR